MEVGQLFTSSKWELLSLISNEELSPIEMAARLSTTMANVSQQLRLLEAMGLVKKRRLPNRDKGKPRMVFSLTDDFGYIVTCMEGYSGRRFIKLDDHHRYNLKAWCSFEPEYHYFLERVYWKLEPYLPSIDFIQVRADEGSLLFEIGSFDQSLKKKLEDFTISKESTKRSIKFKHVQKKSLDKGWTELHSHKKKGGGI